MNKKSRMPEIGETIFTIIYLVFGFISAIILLTHIEGRNHIRLFGILTLVLAGGDSFHLVPRIIHAFKERFEGFEFWAGLGLMVSSITMTIFYIVLYFAWKDMFGTTVGCPGWVEILLFACAGIRILICLFPQNNWLHKEGNPKWGIYRNVPFAVVGLIMIVLFAKAGMWGMAIAILVSFGCYMPVALFAKKNPKVGILMLPKTAAYMVMIGIGLSLL